MPEVSALTAVDRVIIVALAISTLLSLWRGFVREALSPAGLVAACLRVILFVDLIASHLFSSREKVLFSRLHSSHNLLKVNQLSRCNCLWQNGLQRLLHMITAASETFLHA